MVLCESGKHENLKFSEYVLLFHIRKWTQNNSNGASSSELSNHMHVKPPTINPLLLDLEKSGLIIRRKDPNDRRIIRINLTEEGLSHTKEVEKAFYFRIHELAQHLGPQKSNQLADLMDEVYEYFSQ
jgi:DNA-binding MarR family transcriptional regulator